MDESRILGEHIELDENEVKKFFDERCKKQLPHLYNYTNYQDKHPNLVLKRDLYEKEKICPLLSIKDDTRVLDIGCGVGRWASTILSKGGTYVGVDYSSSLLNLAMHDAIKKSLDKRRYEFICASFQNITKQIPDVYSQKGFDVILVNGVMMYINDNDLSHCIRNIDSLLKKKGVLYVKETVSYTERLTLNHVYSDELSSHYSAIYRSMEEYVYLWRKFLDGYVILAQGDLWEMELKNRKDTAPYYWIISKA